MFDSKRVQLECRLLTGTYSLQSNKTVFNQHLANPRCKLCVTVLQKIANTFLRNAPAYGEAREKVADQVSEMSERFSVDVSFSEELIRRILDLSVCTDSKQDIYKLELHSREMIHTLHYKRKKTFSTL